MILLTSALLFASSIAATEPRPHETDFLPVSVWYSGGKARAPMLSDITPDSPAEWRRDLEQIKKLGLNTVRTWVEWAHCEPREGQFQFDNLRLLCRLANDVGLRVIVQVYADSAPDWVGQKHPDARFEAQSGEKVQSQAAPGYCTDKPEVGGLVARFYTETARVANEFPNLYAWDLWSEPHIINWAIIDYVPNAQFCFCPHTRERFRRWLVGESTAGGSTSKYGSLKNLNRAWYRNFQTIAEVDPPRFGTILSYTDFIDWKTFIYEKLAADLRMRYDAIRKADTRHVITSHAAVPSIFTSPFEGDGASDDFLMAGQVDFYGTSIYPKHSFPNRHWPQWQINVALDFTRSANLRNGGFYVGELQAGFGVRGLVAGDPITPEDHRVWMWGAIARGAKAVNLYAYYPMSSGYESGGYGLIELDGRITRRAESAGKTAQIIHRHRDLLLKSKPQLAQVAILYNPLSQMIGGEQNSGPPGGFRDSLIGYYRALASESVPVDFVHRRTLETGLPPQYKLLIVPYPVMMTAKAADAIKAFVEQGGHVLAEARLAWNDESGRAAPVIPGMGLSEVFGVRESVVIMSDHVAMTITDDAHPVTAGLRGKTLKGAYFAETFEPLPESKTRVLDQLTEPASSSFIVASDFGRGQTLIVGSFLGLGSHPTPDANNRRFILNLLEWSAVKRPFTVTSNPHLDPPLEVYLRDTDGGQLLFIINPSQTNASATIQLPAASVEYEWRDLLNDEHQQQKADSGFFKLDSTIPARDVKIIFIKPN